MPPTPEEIAAFVGDSAADAYEKLIDRFLASPEYGERWARHWLDVVRFAESNGFETNLARPNAWPYRDYVIAAFNSDKPYKDFIIEQLAGDRVGVDVATGFLVAGPWDNVTSPQLELTRLQRLAELDDMVSTTSTAFLGLSAGCAKCHDHKFDPITQHDYYSLAANFAGVKHGERPIETSESKEKQKRSAAIGRELATLDEDQRRLIAGVEPLAVVGQQSATPHRGPVHPAGNVERFTPIMARFVRFTVRATNNLEPCIDELEIFSAEPESAQRGARLAGRHSTASGVFDEGKYPLHQLAHINDGRYGNPRSWISNQRGSGWVQIELPKPTLISRVEWARDRDGKFNDRLPTDYRIEVATTPNKWQMVASSADRALYAGAAKPAPPKIDDLPPNDAVRLCALMAKRESLEAELVKLPPPLAYLGKFVQPSEPTYLLNRGDPMQRREETPPGAIAAVGQPLKLTTDTPEAERRLVLRTGSPMSAIL